MINCVIMASGYGRRMGKNKLLLPYKDKTLVEHIIEKVNYCDFYTRVIVARDERILNLAINSGLKAVKNNNANIGQSQSIKLGINNLPKADGYMFFTADQPLLDIETIKVLMNTFEKSNKSIIVPRVNNRNGSPVIFPLRLIYELKTLQGDNCGRQVINNHIEDVIFVYVRNEYLLMDVDTWEDYKKIINIKG